MRSLLRSLPSKRKQKGAVAIVLGVSLVTLFAMGGVVLDLGHLYIAKSELQNAADAAALAGAKSLNETTAGITDAIAKAQAIGAKNKYNFSTDVSLNSTTDIQFGSSPDGPWFASTALPNPPKGITFVRVDTGSKSLDTYLMRVVGTAFNTVSTSGVAVAGRFVNNVTPIGVCAIKDAAGVSRPKGEALSTGELAQFGFRRGVSYNIFALGPLGASSDPYLLDPVDVYPNPCNPSNSSANTTAPLICNGSSAILTSTPGTVYGNTGVSAGKIQAALNSRFNNFSPPSVCIPAQAPSDVNVRPFACTGAGCSSTAADWMDPSKQTITPAGIPTVALPIPAGITSKNQYGVLWSYSRAVNAVGTSPDATPGTAFATTDWPTLYPAPGGAPVADADFPVTVSPYLDPSHITAPTVNPSSLNRRVLNMAIANCPAITGSGACQVIPVLGIGRFFMQVPADFSGSPKKLEVEFAGLIEPVPVSEIKLYR